MRFCISPAERNSLESDVRASLRANVPDAMGRDLAPVDETTDRALEEAHRAMSKKRRFGRMAHREKPATW